ncbi:MAG TPA: RNA polymerase subunit sigma-70 [Blastocatellia bacterium]|jgi:RNA polymerase sigma-70 factor (ECF subfamily)|nr:RNA polymerase subunit sigma-70 [Blastocatellia bacterium]HAF23590.1 RNA polymerase subunit sigma-70 [Blastocatellia bacterium]HCX30668.1 RNA polymerase subunit sigma-70 [Blastocatellia bacterium]
MKEQENLSDNELFRSIQAGDENAFTLLYRRRQGGIYRFTLQMGGSPALAEDITQEVFLVLMRGTLAFDPARGTLNAFLYGIARKQLLRRLEREHFYAPLESDADAGKDSPSQDSGPLEDFSRNETAAAVRKAILSLPERYREVVVLCDLEEMSYVDSAAVLGCAVGTVRSRLHRARALLIEKLQPAKTESAASTDVKAARCFA